MDSRELRIGNFVYWCMPEDTLHAVSYIDLECETAYCISPIPLTEGWLVKFGFKKEGGSYFLNEIYVFETSEGYVYEDFGAGKALSKPFKYVHQLQNLFYALTGGELRYI